MTFAAARVATATVNARGLRKGVRLPVMESFTLQENGGLSTITIDLPAGVVDGDLLIVFEVNDGTRTVAAQHGYTRLWSKVLSPGGTNAATHAFLKIASSEPSSRSWSLSGSDKAAATQYRVSDHDATTPIADFDIDTPDSGGAINIPAVTSDINNCLLFHVLGAGGDGGGSFTPPGAGEIVDANADYGGSTGVEMATAHEAFPSGGGTGISVWTISNASQARTGGHIYIQPIEGNADLLELETTTDNLLLEDSSGTIALE